MDTKDKLIEKLKEAKNLLVRYMYKHYPELLAKFEELPQYEALERDIEKLDKQIAEGKEINKVDYLKSILKDVVELYYKEKTKPHGLFKKKMAKQVFQGKDAFKDSGIITRAELAINGMYSLNDNKWIDDNNEVTEVIIEGL